MIACFSVYKINTNSAYMESFTDTSRYVAYGDNFEKCFRNFFYNLLNDIFDSYATIDSISVVSENSLRSIFDYRSIRLDVKTNEDAFTYTICAEASPGGIGVAYKLERIDIPKYNYEAICADLLTNHTYDYDYRIYSSEGEPLSFRRRHAVMTEASKPVVRNQDIKEYLDNTCGIHVKHFPPMFSMFEPGLPGYCGWIECDNDRKLMHCMITRHVW